jgi:hypothetical protein
MNLLPFPRSLKRKGGFYTLPVEGAVLFEAGLPRDTVLLPVAARLHEAGAAARTDLILSLAPDHPHAVARFSAGGPAPQKPDGYRLQIGPGGIAVHYYDEGGLRSAVATLRQLLREHGRRLPRLVIEDYPDFHRRGVMLDISRGRVPNLETLLELVGHLADFKINEFQLYTEHTFAYRNYEPVWREWGPLDAGDILRLDARCRELGIDLVPNQNSFGHLRYWLEYPPLKRLAETQEPYEGVGGTFLRYPSTLASTHPDTLPFLRELYDELLPTFTSTRFNVGCDETWDLGHGQSKEVCEAKGKGRVYLDFLKQIEKEVRNRGKQMMFWGDIILHYPELISELPGDVIALNWGYEANHPFEKEAGLFAGSKIPFYVCPGTSTWMTLIGRHDNAFSNLKQAAEAGSRHGARGYLITDWGDGGHPQPLAVSYAPYVLGASCAWCKDTCSEALLGPVLSRDIFEDPTGRTAEAALRLGHVHRKFNYFAPNVTPFGTVVAAPPPKLRELVCRDGLKYYARIPTENIRSALEEARKDRQVLYRSQPCSGAGEMLACELGMAARMAEESCEIMLWQQALATGKHARARAIAKAGIRRLQELREDFEAYWPHRAKGSTAKCSAFLDWRMGDYRNGRLHFAPEVARA